MSTTAELVQFAKLLRNAAPRAFDEFHAAFASYTRQTTTKLINATENIEVVQGQTQQCMAILSVLEEVKNGQ